MLVSLSSCCVPMERRRRKLKQKWFWPFWRCCLVLLCCICCFSVLCLCYDFCLKIVLRKNKNARNLQWYDSFMKNHTNMKMTCCIFCVVLPTCCVSYENLSNGDILLTCWQNFLLRAGAMLFFYHLRICPKYVHIDTYLLIFFHDERIITWQYGHIYGGTFLSTQHFNWKELKHETCYSLHLLIWLESAFGCHKQ